MLTSSVGDIIVKELSDERGQVGGDHLEALGLDSIDLAQAPKQYQAIGESCEVGIDLSGSGSLVISSYKRWLWAWP